MKHSAEIKIKDYIGDQDILRLRKTAFLCSRKIPASAVLESYDWAIDQRDRGNCIISGFHSVIEKDVFHFLVKGKQPLVLVLHKGLPEAWSPAIEEMLSSNRLLIITPFDKEVRNGSEETAMVRNRLVLDLSHEVRMGYMAPDGNLAKLLAGK